jgi:flagellar FliJ protein
MPPSDRFKPIQMVAAHQERRAAAALGDSMRQRDAAQQRLDELRVYLVDYLDRFHQASLRGLASTQVREYQVFITKLEQAIAAQERVVVSSQQQCAAQKAQWQGRYSKHKAMENAVGRLQQRERQEAERKAQKDTDERAQRRREP